MSHEPKPIGVVLAGGRSSRMGQNKALLNYQGQPLLYHMLKLLKQAGLSNALISGQVPGFDCLTDAKPFSGPAQAMQSIVQKYPNSQGVLFIPTDMPLLTPEMLKRLLQEKNGAYFSNFPLPAFITAPFAPSAAFSVKQWLLDQKVPAIPLADGFLPLMKNANTAEQWKKIRVL